MGFGTNNQIGNQAGTSLNSLFGDNIGAPQPIGTSQAPNQLFNLIQQLLGSQGFGGGGQGFGANMGGDMGMERPPGQGGTPLGSLSAAPVQPQATSFQTDEPQFDLAQQNIRQITNPTNSLINMRFLR